MGFSSQPWIVPRSSNLDFCRIKTNFTVISERNMLSRASLLTQSFSLLPEHLYIWLRGTSLIEFQVIPPGRAYYLAAYSYKCFINYIKIQNHRPSLWKGISFQIVTSEELQNLKVGCSTNSVVDVIRPIFLACTANSLTNLTKSAIPRLFLETFIFTSSKVFCRKSE